MQEVNSICRELLSKSKHLAVPGPIIQDPFPRLSPLDALHLVAWWKQVGLSLPTRFFSFLGRENTFSMESHPGSSGIFFLSPIPPYPPPRSLKTPRIKVGICSFLPSPMRMAKEKLHFRALVFSRSPPPKQENSEWAFKSPFVYGESFPAVSSHP